MHVITTTEPVSVPVTDTVDARLVWIGLDDCGVELEIVAWTCPTLWSLSMSCRPACGGEAMTRRTTYTLGSDVPAGEVLRDSKGRPVDKGYVDAAVDDALKTVRGRGRPSLSASGESPLLRVRISPELNDAVSKAAEAAGESRAEWGRHTLAQAARRTG